jgi:anti-anti-sigma regulatory factor
VAQENESAQVGETSSYLIQWDISRNLVEVRYRGRVTAAEVKAVYEKVMELLPKLRQGFTLLVDLSDLESMDLDCVGDITKIMDACNAAGIGTVARIVPDPRKDIGLNILSIIHYRRGVHMLTFQNPAEAERAISGG